VIGDARQDFHDPGIATVRHRYRPGDLAHHGGSPAPDAASGRTVEIAQGHFTTPIYVTRLRADLNIAGIVALLIGVALAAFPASARQGKGKPPGT
jgi:hypothetical protein